MPVLTVDLFEFTQLYETVVSRLLSHVYNYY